MGTGNFWTVNRTQVTSDLWDLGFAAKPIALVLGLDSPKRVVAKLAHLARTVGLNIARPTRFDETQAKNTQTACLLASAQLMGDTRQRLLETNTMQIEALDLSIDILKAFARTTLMIGEVGHTSPTGIIMQKTQAKQAELLELRAQAVGSNLKDEQQKKVLIMCTRRLAAFVNVLGDPAPKPGQQAA